MPRGFSEGFVNARTNPAGPDPELILPIDGAEGQFQMRHQQIINFALDMGGGFGEGIFSKNHSYNFKWRILETADVAAPVVFEQEVTLVINLTAFVVGAFGGVDLSLTSWAPVSEEIRTTVVDGQPTDENRARSNNSINGVPYDNSAPTPKPYTDAFGRPLSDMASAFAALTDPAFIHTLTGYTLSEFGIEVEDNAGAAGGGVGTGEAIIEAAWYSPIYNCTLKPGMAVDIIHDEMTTRTLREELYQFKFGVPLADDDVSATVDMFGGVAIATLNTNEVYIRYGQEPFMTLQGRALQSGVHQPSILVDNRETFWLNVIDNTAKVYEERRSRNGAISFERLLDLDGQNTGLIYGGLPGMPQGFAIGGGNGNNSNSDSNERGVILFEGNKLLFKHSADTWASAIVIAEFNVKDIQDSNRQTANPVQPMAGFCTPTGVIYADNGKGLGWRSRDRGASWERIGIDTR